MTLTIRNFISLTIAVLALAISAAPARAQDEAKVAKNVAKTLVKYDKTVLSYERKIDALVAKCTTKVEKMVESDTDPAKINAFIAKSIMTGMNHAGVSRAKIDATEAAGLKSLIKYGSPAAAVTTISTSADESIAEIDAIWDEAGTALHALEVDE